MKACQHQVLAECHPKLSLHSHIHTHLTTLTPSGPCHPNAVGCLPLNFFRSVDEEHLPFIGCFFYKQALKICLCTNHLLIGTRTHTEHTCRPIWICIIHNYGQETWNVVIRKSEVRCSSCFAINSHADILERNVELKNYMQHILDVLDLHCLFKCIQLF